MDERSEFLLQILERLGAPLMAAISGVSTEADPEGKADPVKDAGRMAELLGKSVQSSIALASALHATGGNDSIRLTLTALAANLIASQYRLTHRPPSERDIERITGALTAVLSFADNFSPAKENASRLKVLDIESAAYDEHQVHAVFFHAFSPAISAVSTYAFGRQDMKLLQEIAKTITARARELREKLFPSVSEVRDQRQVELGLVKSLVAIYVECHKAETERLLGMNEQQRAEAAQANGGVLSMDPVWNAFAIRTAMLEALAPSILPGGATAVAVSGSVAPDAPKANAPSSAPEKPAIFGAQQAPEPPPDSASQSPPAAAKPAIFSAKKAEGTTAPPPTEAKTSSPPPQVPTEPPAPKDENYNPMSFFKKPGSEGSS